MSNCFYRFWYNNISQIDTTFKSTSSNLLDAIGNDKISCITI